MDKKNQKERRVKKRRQAEEALRASEVRHQAILEWALDAIISVDREGRIIEFNRAAETMFGHASKDVTGKEMVPLIIPPALRERHRAGWERHLATGTTSIICKRIEITAMRADGAEFPIELIVTRFGPDGNPTFTAFIRDITERKRAEKALQQAHQEHQELVNTIDGIVWEADAQTFQFSYVSQKAERLLGYPIAQWLNEPTFWADHIHPDDRERTVAFCVNATKEMRDHTFECRMLTADGHTVWLHDIVTVVVVNNQAVNLRGVMVDITERKRTEEERARLLKEVQDNHERLQHLSRRLLDVQEEERSRIARELHDETGQSLTALLLGLRMLDEMSTSETAQARVDDLREIAARALDEVKRLAMGLRPALLDDLGLEAALKRLAEDSGKTHGIFVDLHMNGLNKRRMAFPVETTIYRIVQEALTNAGRHAAARNVSILLTGSESSVKLIIEDDGRGFDVENTLRLSDSAKHLGLLGMHERVALLHGTFSVESTPGSGTTIYVQLPLEAQPS